MNLHNRCEWVGDNPLYHACQGGLSNDLWRYPDGPGHQPPAIPGAFSDDPPLLDWIPMAGQHPDCKFVGSTIHHAWLQAVVAVNDHTTEHFRQQSWPADVRHRA